MPPALLSLSLQAEESVSHGASPGELRDLGPETDAAKLLLAPYPSSEPHRHPAAHGAPCPPFHICWKFCLMSSCFSLLSSNRFGPKRKRRRISYGALMLKYPLSKSPHRRAL